MPTVADRIEEGREYAYRHIYALNNLTVNTLYGDFDRAYDELAKAISRIFDTMVRGETWSVQDLVAKAELLRQISRAMDGLELIQNQAMLDGKTEAYKAGMAGAGYMLDTSIFAALGAGIAKIPLLPTGAIRAQAQLPYEGMAFGERFRLNRLEFQVAAQRSFTQSQILGEGRYQAQKRLAEAMGVNIGMRTKADRASNRALFAKTEMAVRTEMMAGSNIAALAVYERNPDVLRGYEIKAALDERTCPTCGKLDGQVFEFGKGQRPPFHVRCRCTVIPVLIDTRLQDEIAGPRVTFVEWAAKRGLSRDAYGSAYDLRGQAAPVKAA